MYRNTNIMLMDLYSPVYNLLDDHFRSIFFAYREHGSVYPSKTRRRKAIIEWAIKNGLLGDKNASTSDYPLSELGLRKFIISGYGIDLKYDTTKTHCDYYEKLLPNTVFTSLTISSDKITTETIEWAFKHNICFYVFKKITRWSDMLLIRIDKNDLPFFILKWS